MTDSKKASQDQHPYRHVFDPKLDLVLERTVDVPRELLWTAWTDPAHLKQWFTPRPWTTSECEIDLRPGGIFRTVLAGPEGERFANVGCYLEIVNQEKLVWTNAMLPGFRPKGKPAADAAAAGLTFTAIIAFESAGPSRTKYTATVLHSSEEDRDRHDTMGFQNGWGSAFDQLVAMIRAR
jgi:uncharacterized protein YndB with AHSA1/START domain